MKSLDRLYFLQGGRCFFCHQPLAKNDASVEHLLASANGGANADENCVVCCKLINHALGSMSLKEKFQAILNQKGDFKCPKGISINDDASKPQPESQPKPQLESKPDPKPTHELTLSEKYDIVVANMIRRGKARPGTLKTLRTTITAYLKGIPEIEVTKLIEELLADGKIVVDGKNVIYKF